MTKIGSHEIEFERTEKAFFPDAGVTKGDLIAYYRDIAEVMLPHLRDRPLALERFPDGIEEEGFFQQDCPDYFPGWIDTVKAARRDTSEKQSPVRHVVCTSEACLAYLANQGVVTLHGWLSRAPEIDRPDKLIFDLDPPGSDFDAVINAARRVSDLMQELELNPYLMTTGSKGLHVIAPLNREAGFDTVRDVATAMAEHLAKRYPEDLTTEQRKAKREGRVYLDVMRNAYGQTTVMPYTVRAKPGAPVATPLSWDELDRGGLSSQSYTLENIGRRLGQIGDPWRGILREGRDIAAVRDRLGRLREDG